MAVDFTARGESALDRRISSIVTYALAVVVDTVTDVITLVETNPQKDPVAAADGVSVWVVPSFNANVTSPDVNAPVLSVR
jgi:hypothetical protein